MTEIVKSGGKFADIVAETQAIINEARKTAEKAFLIELKDVFSRHPEIKMFKWCQYTPYFNDGDACEFSVNEIYFSNYDINCWGEFEETDEQDSEPADFFCEYLSNYGDALKKYPDLAGLSQFMNSSEGEYILEFMFGDHVQVTVTKDGTTIDEYNHD